MQTYFEIFVFIAVSVEVRKSIHYGIPSDHSRQFLILTRRANMTNDKLNLTIHCTVVERDVYSSIPIITTVQTYLKLPSTYCIFHTQSIFFHKEFGDYHVRPEHSD